MIKKCFMRVKSKFECVAHAPEVSKDNVSRQRDKSVIFRIVEVEYN